MNKNGFSFLSLLISLVIIAILMSLFLPQFKQTLQQEHATQVNAIKQAQQLQEQLNAQTQVREQMMNDLEGAPHPRKRR